MKHGRQILLSFALLLLIGSVDVVRAGEASASASASMSVSVTVREVIRLEQAGASALQVTETDLARGWIEAPRALRSAVATNVRGGYLVRYELDRTVAQSAKVGDLMVGPGGAFEMGRGSSSSAQDVRIELARNLRPGTYDFPVSTTVHPISGSAQNERPAQPVVMMVDSRR